MDDLYHVANVLPPVANAFAGVAPTAVVNMKNWQHASFLLQCGVGPVGTATITVEACDDATPSNTVPIPFFYQECIAGDTFGPIKQAPATGFVTAAASDKVYKVEVEDQSLADTGFGYVRLKSTELVVGEITGGVVVVLTDGRFESEVPDTVLV